MTTKRCKPSVFSSTGLQRGAVASGRLHADKLAAQLWQQHYLQITLQTKKRNRGIRFTRSSWIISSSSLPAVGNVYRSQMVTKGSGPNNNSPHDGARTHGRISRQDISGRYISTNSTKRFHQLRCTSALYRIEKKKKKLVQASKLWRQRNSCCRFHRSFEANLPKKHLQFTPVQTQLWSKC